jgi:hypothetical protein
VITLIGAEATFVSLTSSTLDSTSTSASSSSESRNLSEVLFWNQVKNKKFRN